MKSTIKFLAVAVGVASVGVSVSAQVTLDQVKSATTVEEFLTLGARQISADQFEQVVVGHMMDEGSWTWIINADGSHASEAKDGSWSDEGGRWELRGNQYCRNSVDNPEMGCSDVFIIGDYLRMGSEGELAGWTVKIN